MQDDLFAAADVALPVERERVLMSLNPEYYELIWQGLKRHEFRRRYLADRPTSWYVYLTAPVSKLAAVIDLDIAIVDTPRRIGTIAKQAREPPRVWMGAHSLSEDVDHGGEREEVLAGVP